MARRADHGTADPTRRAVTTIQGTSLVGMGAGCHPFSRVPVPTSGCGHAPARPCRLPVGSLSEGRPVHPDRHFRA